MIDMKKERHRSFFVFNYSETKKWNADDADHEIKNDLNTDKYNLNTNQFPEGLNIFNPSGLLNLGYVFYSYSIPPGLSHPLSNLLRFP
jgi:hypothetical protein